MGDIFWSNGDVFNVKRLQAYKDYATKLCSGSQPEYLYKTAFRHKYHPLLFLSIRQNRNLSFYDVIKLRLTKADSAKDK